MHLLLLGHESTSDMVSRAAAYRFLPAVPGKSTQENVFYHFFILIGISALLSVDFFYFYFWF